MYNLSVRDRVPGLTTGAVERGGWEICTSTVTNIFSASFIRNVWGEFQLILEVDLNKRGVIYSRHKSELQVHGNGIVR